MYVAVVSSREEGVPTLDSVEALFDNIPLDTSAPQKTPINRLKDGWRAVKVAVVDAGVISFFTLNDVYFNREEMY